MGDKVFNLKIVIQSRSALVYAVCKYYYGIKKFSSIYKS